MSLRPPCFPTCLTFLCDHGEGLGLGVCRRGEWAFTVHAPASGATRGPSKPLGVGGRSPAAPWLCPRRTGPEISPSCQQDVGDSVPRPPGIESTGQNRFLMEPPGPRASAYSPFDFHRRVRAGGDGGAMQSVSCFQRCWRRGQAGLWRRCPGVQTFPRTCSPHGRTRTGRRMAKACRAEHRHVTWRKPAPHTPGLKPPVPAALPRK